ncbi:uncharacterized protein UBRO_20012 [Ustilago bromivora]|uniref:Uncharacterized protein n=1 Tax=Ustilago bromivora TaxID=307758 RepID=A0A1K0GYC7_9BASI|nr:uncharacterized protein UBRO_20012 [Ustilago bromivora]
MEEPKDGPIFDYSSGINGKQVVMPLTILIKCASHLYFATHELGPFRNDFNLGKQMRARINFFIANEDNLNIEGNKPSTSTDTGNVPYYRAADIGQHGTRDATSSGSEAQHTETSEKPLCGREATPDKPLCGRETTPTATPELTQLTNHHLKALTSLSDKLRWDEKELLDPKRVSVHAWRRWLRKKLSVIPFVCDILDRKLTTFNDTDSLLHSIIMHSFSPQLWAEYFSERGDRPIEIAVDLYDRYKTLKRALPSDRNTILNSIFVLYETLIEEYTSSSVANVLRKCYELAADSAPVRLATHIEDVDLSALRAATLVNCWA